MTPTKASTLRTAIGGAVIAMALISPCTAASTAIYITRVEIAAVMHRLSPIGTDDEPVRVIDAGDSRIGIFLVGRPKKEGLQPASADGAIPVTEGLALTNVGEVLRILKGRGALVSGGRLIDPSPIATDDPDLAVIGPGFRSKRILGGETRSVKEGDVVVIPAGVPHGFSAIEKPLLYEIIRIDRAKTLPLK